MRKKLLKFDKIMIKIINFLNIKNNKFFITGKIFVLLLTKFYINRFKNVYDYFGNDKLNE